MSGPRPLYGLFAAAVLVVAGLGLLRASSSIAAPERPDEITVTSPAPVAVTPQPLPAQVQPAASPSAAPELPVGSRVVATRLGIDLPLLEGDPSRDIAEQLTPSGAAFHLRGSALPGSPGNAYIYGHARAGMFIGLWQARLGDRVQIFRPDAPALSYVVREIHPRVAPTDLSYLLPTGDERLTLQTSTGPNVTDPRFVVIAMPEGR